jgi:hypothetical protein
LVPFPDPLPPLAAPLTSDGLDAWRQVCLERADQATLLIDRAIERGGEDRDIILLNCLHDQREELRRARELVGALSISAGDEEALGNLAEQLSGLCHDTLRLQRAAVWCHRESEVIVGPTQVDSEPRSGEPE